MINANVNAVFSVVLNIISNNEILWFIAIIVNFAAVLLVFRLWGKVGLFAFVVLSIIVANIQALKQIDLFGLHTSMGDISYVGLYLISDILSENYGKAMARKIVALGLFALLITTITMTILLRFKSNSFDTAQPALNVIFGFLPRLLLASTLAYFASQTYDVAAYQFWRNRYPAYKYIWIRNNCSTLVSQLLDNAIFCFVAFSFIFPWQYVWQIFLTSCLLRSIIAIIDTPFVYWSVKIKLKVKDF